MPTLVNGCSAAGTDSVKGTGNGERCVTPLFNAGFSVGHQKTTGAWAKNAGKVGKITRAGKNRSHCVVSRRLLKSAPNFKAWFPCVRLKLSVAWKRDSR